MSSDDQWPPVSHSSGGRGSAKFNGNRRLYKEAQQQETLKKLNEMFSTVLETDVILSVAQNCNWELQQSIEGLIELSESIESPAAWKEKPEKTPPATSSSSESLTDKSRSVSNDQRSIPRIPNRLTLDDSTLIESRACALEKLEKRKRATTKNRMDSFCGNIAKLKSHELKIHEDTSTKVFDLQEFTIEKDSLATGRINFPPILKSVKSCTTRTTDVTSGTNTSQKVACFDSNVNIRKNESESLCGLKVQYRLSGMESSSDDDADVVIEDALDCTIDLTSIKKSVAELTSTEATTSVASRSTGPEVQSTPSPPRTPQRSHHDTTFARIREHVLRGERVLVLLRGLPGSGKTTLAKSIVASTIGGDPSSCVYSTDDFFLTNGRYVFDPTRLSEAHANNQTRVARAMREARTPIIVDNTNVEAWEMRPYAKAAVKYGYRVEIIEPNTPWARNPKELAIRNSHGVTRTKIQERAAKYEIITSGKQLLDIYRLDSFSDARAEVAKAEVTKPEAAKAEVAKADAAKPEVAKAKVGKAEVAKAEAAKEEVAKAEVAKPEVAKIDARIAEIQSNWDKHENYVLTSHDIESMQSIDETHNFVVREETSGRKCPRNLPSYADKVFNDYLRNFQDSDDESFEILDSTDIGKILDTPDTSNYCDVATKAKTTQTQDSQTLGAIGSERKFCQNTTANETRFNDDAKSANSLSQCWDFTLIREGYELHSRHGHYVSSANDKPKQYRTDPNDRGLRENGHFKPKRAIIDEETKFEIAREVEDFKPTRAIVEEETKFEIAREVEDFKPKRAIVEEETKFEIAREVEDVKPKRAIIEEETKFEIAREVEDFKPKRTIIEEETKFEIAREVEDFKPKRAIIEEETKFEIAREVEDFKPKRTIIEEETKFEIAREVEDVKPKRAIIEEETKFEIAREVEDFKPKRAIIEEETKFEIAREVEDFKPKRAIIEEETKFEIAREVEDVKPKRAIIDEETKCEIAREVEDVKPKRAIIEEETKFEIARENVEDFKPKRAKFDEIARESLKEPEQTQPNPNKPNRSTEEPNLNEISKNIASDEKNLIDLDAATKANEAIIADAKKDTISSFFRTKSKNSDPDAIWKVNEEKLTENSTRTALGSFFHVLKTSILGSVDQTSAILSTSNEEDESFVSFELSSESSDAEKFDRKAVETEEEFDLAKTGSDNVNRITWKESPFPVEPEAPPVRQPEVFVSRMDASTMTSPYDFNVAYVGGTSEPGYRELLGVSRSINADEKKSLPTASWQSSKLMFDKSSMTGEANILAAEKEKDTTSRLNDLIEMFPHYPSEYLQALYEQQCNCNFDWVVDVLCLADVPNLTIENYTRRDEKLTNVDTLKLKRSHSSSPRIRRNRTKDFRSFSLDFPQDFPHSDVDKNKKDDENEILDKFYAQALDDNLPRVSSSTPTLSSTTDANNDVDDEEILELDFGRDFINRLESTCGNPDFLLPDEFKPTLRIKRSMVEELYGLWIRSMNDQMNVLHAQLDERMAKDEAMARAMDREETIKYEEPVIPNLNEIMSMEMALARYQNELKENVWRETPNDMASRLTRQMLYDLLPDIEEQVLSDILKAHGGNFKETCEIIEANIGRKINRTDALRKQQSLLERVNEARKNRDVDENSSSSHTPLIVVNPDIHACNKSGRTHYEDAIARGHDARIEAQRQVSLRIENYNKAAEAYRKGQPQVAAYYSQMVKLHTENIKAAHANAADEFLAAQMHGEDTLDLHNLHVREALQALDVFLDFQQKKLNRSNRRFAILLIITGHGARSSNGLGRIKPAVSKRLISKNIRFTEANVGCLRVTLNRRNGAFD